MQLHCVEFGPCLAEQAAVDHQLRPVQIFDRVGNGVPRYAAGLDLFQQGAFGLITVGAARHAKGEIRAFEHRLQGVFRLVAPATLEALVAGYALLGSRRGPESIVDITSAVTKFRQLPH